MIARGDIRWFRFASPDKRRPVLVLGRPDVLPSLSQIPVIPISTQTRGLPWEVLVGPHDGLASPRCACSSQSGSAAWSGHTWGPLSAQLGADRVPAVGATLIDLLGLS